MAKYNNHSYLDYISYLSMPMHLCFFIIILVFVMSLSWYVNYENKFEDFIDQVKLFLMLLPVFLLLLVHCMSTGGYFFLPFSAEQDSFHRAGGSPWGVALLLVFLIYMVSYQSSLHERWFPLITR